jgi:Zn-dependent protease with chaperone function
MDFFQAQEDARKRTKWLVLYFMLAVAGVILAVYVLVVFVMAYLGGERMPPVGLQWSWELLGLTAAVVGGAMLLGSLFKLMRLSGGGAVVARDMGARQVDPETRNPAERRLLNVVEEMAIASGMVAPEVWVMDHEAGINAFAAGTDPSNAVVAVSRGCLDQLSRNELQGVVAHEFSHILNGDMKLNMRLIGWLFGILMLAIVGRMLLNSMRFSRPSRDRNGGGAMLALVVAGVGLFAIGSIGVFFGRLIQAAISRQREFLADAAAVQFTRDPTGIAGALKKIGAASQGGNIEAPKASEAGHMFFANAGMFSFGLATHPPLDVRIRAIERDWDGKFPERPPREDDEAGGPERDFSRVRAFAGAGTPPPLPALEAVSALPHLQAGTALMGSLDQEWRAAAHSLDDGRALIFGLLLADDESLRAGEIEHLAGKTGPAIAERAGYWRRELSSCHSSQKIALAEISVAALRRLPAEDYRTFRELTRWLIASDVRIDLFEFMLQKLVERHLDSAHGLRQPPKIRHRQLADLEAETNLLVSAMAALGTDPESAYAAAMEEYRSHTGRTLRRLTPPPGGLQAIADALANCDAATPLVKRQLLRLCALAAASDGVLGNLEIELLRAIADAIGCQIPLAALEDLEPDG